MILTIAVNAQSFSSVESLACEVGSDRTELFGPNPINRAWRKWVTLMQ
jgi:hypothetical protein